MEEQEATEAAAATAEADDLPAADEEPAMARAGANWWCLCYHQWTENKSLSAAENSGGANFFWTKSRNQRMTRTCVLFRTPGFMPHQGPYSQRILGLKVGPNWRI